MPMGVDSRLWLYDADWNPLIFNDDASYPTGTNPAAPEASWGGPDAYWSYIKATLQAGVTYYVEVSSFITGDNFEYRLQVNPGNGISATLWTPPLPTLSLYEIGTDYPAGKNAQSQLEGNGSLNTPDGFWSDAWPPLGMWAGFTFEGTIGTIPTVMFDGVPIAQESRWSNHTGPAILTDEVKFGNNRTFFRVFFGSADPTVITFEADGYLPCTLRWKQIPLLLNCDVIGYTEDALTFTGGTEVFTGRNLTGGFLGVAGPWVIVGSQYEFQGTGVADSSLTVPWAGSHSKGPNYTFDLIYNMMPGEAGLRVKTSVSGWNFNTAQNYPPYG